MSAARLPSASSPLPSVAAPIPREVVFVDGGLQDPASLAELATEGRQVVILDAARDGLEQIAEYLAGRHDLDAIHIVGHGEAGAQRIGTTVLDAATLEAAPGVLACIGASLGQDGDILLYGCNVAAGPAGEALLARLATLTGADVAASTNVTSGAAAGGDAVLEYSVGAIGTQALALPDGFEALGVWDVVSLRPNPPGDNYGSGLDYGGEVGSPYVQGNFVFTWDGYAEEDSHTIAFGTHWTGRVGANFQRAVYGDGLTELSIGTVDGSEFRASGFLISTLIDGSSSTTWVFTGYRDGQAVTPAVTVTGLATGGDNHIAFNDPAFNNIDRLVLTSEDPIRGQTLTLDYGSPITDGSLGARLSPGDIAVIGYDSLMGNAAFVALADLPGNHYIFITTSGWNSATQSWIAANTGLVSPLNHAETMIAWKTPPGGVAAGTVFQVTDLPGGSSTGYLYLNANYEDPDYPVRDQINIFDLPASDAIGTPNFVYGANITDQPGGANGFHTEFSEDTWGEGGVPLGLTAAAAGGLGSAFGLIPGGAKGALKPGVLVDGMTREEALRAIHTPSNWEGLGYTEDDAAYDFAARFDDFALAVGNAAPTLTAIAALAGALEDTTTEITFSALVAAGDEADTDGTVQAFVVTGVANGSLYIGASIETATAFAAGTNDVIDAGHKAFWQPNANANGIMPAFNVVARDDAGATSASPTPVNVQVTAVNDAPVIAGITADDSRGILSSAGVVLVDQGTAVTVADADGNLDWGSVIVYFSAGERAGDVLGIRTGSGVELSNGLANGSQVTVNGTVIGSLQMSDGDPTLTIMLEGGIAPGLIGTLFQNVTFEATGGEAGMRRVALTVQDGDGGNAAAHVELTVENPPTVVITASQATLRAGESTTVTFDFSEVPVGFSAADVTVSGGTLSGLAQEPDQPLRYTATFTPSASDSLAAQISVAAGAFQNGAGVNNAASAPLAITGDTLAPTIASIVRADSAGEATHADQVTFTVTFSEDMGSGFGTGSLVVTGGSLAAVQSMTRVNGTLDAFTVTVGGGNLASFNGTVGLALAGSHGLADVAGNALVVGTPAGSVQTYTLDNLAPTASLAVDDGAYKAGDTITFTVSYDEDVVLAAPNGAPTLSLRIGEALAAATYDAAASTASQLVFRYIVQNGDADANGLEVLGLAHASGGGIADAAGNPSNEAAVSSADTSGVLVDTAGPQVSMVLVPANGVYGAGAELQFSVLFDEAVVLDTAGGTPRLALAVGSQTVYATGAASADASTLVFSYTVQAGEIDANGITVGALDANGATLRDAAGNLASLTLNSIGSTTGVLVDGVAPDAPEFSVVDDAGSVTGPVAHNGYTDDTSLTVQGLAEAGSIVKLYNHGEVVDQTTADAATGAWSFAVTPGSAASSFTVTATDAAGNESGVAGPHAVTLDTTAPTVADVARADLVEPGASFTIAVTYADTGSGIDPSTIDVEDIVVDGPGALEVTNASYSDGVATYTVTRGTAWDPAADSGTYTVRIQAGQVLDRAGNAIAADDEAHTFEIFLNQAPTITSNGGGATASVSAAENQTQVTTVVAHDPEAGAIVYAIDGGADAARFHIDVDTGVLTFLAAPDYEAPLDGGTVAGDNVYEVVVKATDAAGTSVSQALSVTVTDANDAPTVSAAITASATEGGGAQAIDLLQFASDADAGAALHVRAASLVFTVDGVATGDAGRLPPAGIRLDGDALAIDPADPGFDGLAQGETRTIVATFLVEDEAGGTVEQTATITLTGTNDAPVIGGVSGTVQRVTVGQATALPDFTVADADGDIFTVTLTAVNGVLNGVTDLDANLEGIQLAGTAAEINAELAAMTFSAAGVGAASIDIVLADALGAQAQATHHLTASHPPEPEPQPTEPPPPEEWAGLPDDDGDGVPELVEALVPGMAGGVQGDGNGDGIADVDQRHVSSLPWAQSPDGTTRFLTLVNDSGLGFSGVRPIAVDAEDVPAQLALPVGLVAFETTGVPVGATMQYTVYLDADIAVNGYWKQIDGGWTNIAQSVTSEGGKTKIVFSIQDGGAFDADGVADGRIVDPGGPGWMTAIDTDADDDQFPDALEAGHGLVVGEMDNDVFASSKFFVMQLYRDFLYREAEHDGLAYWQDLLEGGHMTREQIAATFLDMPEFQAEAGAVARLYLGALDRVPDDAGLGHWVGQLRDGAGLHAMADQFAASAEFQAAYGALADLQFVDEAYRNVLGRAADAAGRDYWLGRLEDGATRGDVMLGLTQSAEYVAASAEEVALTLDYVGLLGRVPDEAGWQHWVADLEAGASRLDVLAHFLATAEYHDRFLPPEAAPATLVAQPEGATDELA